MPKKMKPVEMIKQSDETEVGKEILGRIKITSKEESLKEMEIGKIVEMSIRTIDMRMLTKEIKKGLRKKRKGINEMRCGLAKGPELDRDPGHTASEGKRERELMKVTSPETWMREVEIEIKIEIKTGDLRGKERIAIERIESKIGQEIRIGT